MRALAVTSLTVIAIGASSLPAGAAYPGKPGRLAFVQGDVGNGLPYGIASSNPKGDDERLIGPTCQAGKPAPCPNNPAWSRYGATLAFDIGGRIATMNADGTNVRRFRPHGLIGLSRPSWDPTGSFIAFQASNFSGDRNIYISAPDGSALRQLTFAGGSEPAWSLGGRIAFVRNGDVYVIGSDGSGKRRLTGKGGARPDWSPHSSQLVFVRGGNTYRVHQDGSGLTKLTGKTGYEPVWSPAGTRVLFHRKTGANRAIYSVDLNASDLQLQTAGTPGTATNANSVSQQPAP